jgi:hypothetical protein
MWDWPILSGSLTPGGGVSVKGNLGGTDQSRTSLKSDWPPENRTRLKSTAALAKRYHPRLITYAQHRQLVTGVARVWIRLESGVMVRARATIAVPEIAAL